ncbi:MAG TPA: hypothetical protein VIX20_07790 [Ktedonobacteraceae bacterium]
MHDFEKPTEPMSQVFLPPYSAPTFQTGISTDRNAIPAPQLDEVPFPKSSANVVDISGMPANPPMYPILPPAVPDIRKGGSPGVAGVYPGKPDTFVQRKTRRSSFPALVGLFFLAVQCLLLLRLLLSLFGAPIGNVWVGLVYTVSTFFLLPLMLLLLNVKIPLINGTALYSALLIVGAIFVYGFLSRIFVRFFKTLLNAR